RRAAGGDRRAEERRARDERLVEPRRCLADEGLERVEHLPPLPRRCLARGEAGDPAFENAETSARCERSGGNAAVLRLGGAAVASARGATSAQRSRSTARLASSASPQLERTCAGASAPSFSSSTLWTRAGHAPPRTASPRASVAASFSALASPPAARGVSSS